MNTVNHTYKLNISFVKSCIKYASGKGMITGETHTHDRHSIPFIVTTNDMIMEL